MYVTMRHYEGVDVEVIKKRAESRSDDSEIVGLVSEFPGFIAYFLVDLGDGSMMAISAYLGEAEAQVSSNTAVEWIREHRTAEIPNPPTILGGDVITHAFRAP